MLVAVGTLIQSWSLSLHNFEAKDSRQPKQKKEKKEKKKKAKKVKKSSSGANHDATGICNKFSCTGASMDERQLTANG